MDAMENAQHEPFHFSVSLDLMAKIDDDFDSVIVVVPKRIF